VETGIKRRGSITVCQAICQSHSATIRCEVRCHSAALNAADSSTNAPAFNAAGICGAPVIWFDYELGEKEFYKGFVCHAHRVNSRVEKLVV
jgi:hypothetical protein